MIDGDKAAEVNAKRKPYAVRAVRAGSKGLYFHTDDGVGRERAREGDWVLEHERGDGQPPKVKVVTDAEFRREYAIVKVISGTP